MISAATGAMALHPGRPAAGAGRRVQARLADALRLALGHHRLRQRAGHPDFLGTDARADRPRPHRIRAVRRRTGDHLPAAAHHPRGAITAGGHRRAHRRGDRLRRGRAQRGRHGPAA
ncbi:hypothetical protein G6F35_016890 [Rhizopus arrhizus]|nr:hypothetical protein G6F35_016890 [Rhizopus arrhizus]